MKQYIRDEVAGELTFDYFLRRMSEGWSLTSIEWVREVQDATLDAGPELFSRNDPSLVPFGLKLSAERSGLEGDAFELAVLSLILRGVVEEKSITEIASRLNLAGHRTRDGVPWTPTAVFNLLPRLIEVGPALLKSTGRPN